MSGDVYMFLNHSCSRDVPECPHQWDKAQADGPSDEHKFWHDEPFRRSKNGSIEFIPDSGDAPHREEYVLK